MCHKHTTRNETERKYFHLSWETPPTPEHTGEGGGGYNGGGHPQYGCQTMARTKGVGGKGSIAFFMRNY